MHANRCRDVVVSQNKGPQYRPQNTMAIIIGTPKRGTPNLGNPHVGFGDGDSPQVVAMLLRARKV